MSLARAVWLLLCLSCAEGCRVPKGTWQSELENVLELEWIPSDEMSGENPPPLASPLAQSAEEHHHLGATDPWDHVPVLEADALVAEVLRLNPSIEVMKATWRAATERYPQVTAWADPRFRFLSGPTFFGDNDGVVLWRFQFQQKIPWFGKTRLRGDKAIAESEAAFHDLGLTRLDVIETARTAFNDYAALYEMHQLAQRDTDVVEEYGRFLAHVADESPRHAYDHHAVELAALEAQARRDELTRALRIATAQINILLQRPPDRRLPPPYCEEIDRLPLDLQDIRQLAYRHRPDVAAAKARFLAAQFDTRLAQREYFPDFEVIGRLDSIWDSIWPQRDANVRPQFGFNVDLPLQQFRRHAAVREAQGHVRAQRGQLERLLNKIDFEVATAWEGYELASADLGRAPQMLAAAEGKAAALAQLVHDKPDYNRDLFAARRQVVTYQVKLRETERNYRQQLIALERAVGCNLVHGPPPWESLMLEPFPLDSMPLEPLPTESSQPLPPVTGGEPAGESIHEHIPPGIPQPDEGPVFP